MPWACNSPVHWRGGVEYAPAHDHAHDRGRQSMLHEWLAPASVQEFVRRYLGRTRAPAPRPARALHPAPLVAPRPPGRGLTLHFIGVLPASPPALYQPAARSRFLVEVSGWK